MKTPQITARSKERYRRRGLPWIGLGVWFALLLTVDMTSRTIGLQERQVVYLVLAALASLAVVMLMAFARLAESPSDLRMLRLLAVLLPSAFVLCVEVILYFVEIENVFTEVGEHVVATAILSAGALPFSVYVFRSFTRLRDELAQRAHRLQTLHEASLSVTGELAVPRLHERIVAGARTVAGSGAGALLLSAELGSAETFVAWPPEEGEPAAGVKDFAEAIASGGEATRERRDGDSLLGVPVRRSGRAIGAIVVSRRGGAGFDVEDQLVLDMFGVAASAGIENALRLEEALLLATVEERERIARDLHDDLGQLLGFVTAKIQAAQELVATGRGGLAREELASLESASRLLGAQVREAILGLRARVGPGRWLGGALEDYVADFGIQAGLQTEFRGSPDAGRSLPGPAQYQLLRIAQEALSNARRHARARKVTVRLAETNGDLELAVADDGVGFERAGGGSGFGLKTMAERAGSLHGTFDVSSRPGAGTVITVRVPTEGG